MKTSIFTQIGNFFGDLQRAHAATRAYERLSALSDERLAARGLKRTDIVAVAFDEAFRK